MDITLKSLFRRCLSIEYINTSNECSYASEKIGDTLYIYFEKSNGLKDWKSNFNFPAKATEGFFAHRGFLACWSELLPFVDSIIRKSDAKKIVVCGYSHGGALAVLCHQYICQHFKNLHLEGYGFGAPRVVWGICKCKSDWKGFTVIRNIDDIVTHLPPAFFGYRHVGELITVGQRGKYSSVDAHREENILRELSTSDQRRL